MVKVTPPFTVNVFEVSVTVPALRPELAVVPDLEPLTAPEKVPVTATPPTATPA
jgi:hypothetical protein